MSNNLKSIVEDIVFVELVFFLLLTSPLWIIPYSIYRLIKERC